MKSIVSKDALHNSFELANSKFVDLPLSTASINLNPLPSSMFFFTLNSGLGGDFLASPLFAHEFNKKGKIHTKINNFKVFFENIVNKQSIISINIYNTYISKISKKTLNKGIFLGVA